MAQTAGNKAGEQVPTRRDIIRAGVGAGGALFVVFGIPSIAKVVQADAGATARPAPAPAPAPAAAAGPPFMPSGFVRIDPAGTVTLTMPQVEMGQGTYTSMPMLIAEELEVELSQVKLAAAPADDKLYGNPLIGFQVTGGSTSVRGFFKPLRVAGATAREMLIAGAAKTWGVDPASCRAEKGVVVHDASGRRAPYGELVATAAAVAVPTDVKLKDPKSFKLIGTSARRLDVADKTTGRAQFGIDVRLPGLLIATVAASPVIGGKLRSVDDTAAKAVKGVRQIVRLEDAVAVVADHMGAARKGLAALAIVWDEGANAKVGTADVVATLQAATTQSGVVAERKGDVDAAMAAAAKTVEAVYELPFLAHTTMEPMNCTVHLRKDACDLWVGSQVVSRARATAADVTGLPPERIAVHNHLLGGGFGRRLEIDFVTQAVQIAKQVDAPVKVVWSREEDIQHDIYRPYYVDRLKAGLDAGGRPSAFHHRVTGSSIMARWVPAYFKDGLDADAVDGAAGPYDFDNLLVDYVRREPPAGLLTGWWRGVGVTHNAFMVESFIDELAQAAGREPIDYRRALLARQPRARAVLDLVAEKAGWGAPMPKGRGRGVALLFGFGTYVAQVAEVDVSPKGEVRVSRVVCAVDCGITINPDTVRAQMEGGIVYGLTAALYGEITLKNGRVEQSNFDNYQALRINEVPAIEVHIVSSLEEPGGIGEPGTSGIAPALVNAIYAATGKRLRKLPIDGRQLAAT
ncbi:xanthine dehydrogenase family protein molybdopterin-binding subunit [Chelatococcus reniformis]|uniref:Aldehyde dehydrogenase n=1 Tax=Chelatococcus reniformis TaxID=1494448 RepID=A0A916XCJ8_9HYPH|nr:xanthine dehydrogenase family protein molybdopterin-binding subunit [Chelatococcus reniformis]GGC60618.1 aldehyde dehydrogenase [Chelatococcus reniformis]